MAPPRDEIGDALARLVSEGGDDNRLVVSSGPAWLLYTAAKGDTAIRCAAAAASFLPKDRRLTLEAVHLLRRAGFANRPGSKTLQRTYPLPDGAEAGNAPGRIADDGLTDLREVYRADFESEPVALSLHLAQRDLTENPKLIEAIRKLSKQRDGASRQAMYRQMIRATFLLPVDETGAPVPMGELMGFPVFGVFTDADCLFGWDPRVTRYERLHGRVLFPRMARTGLGSLLINPKGKVGGELYRNEVEMLADAIR